MSLRDQPYLPLYVQDFLTDEKLAQCSAKATGVYIRLICIMHKSEQYGTILLKQKHKQTSEQIKNFASQLVKHLPYDFHIVTESLAELLDENVLIIEGDILIQKRMVKDNKISELRAKSGKKGGLKNSLKGKNFASHFAKAKTQANTETENENENENENDFNADKNNLLASPEKIDKQESLLQNFNSIGADSRQILPDYGEIERVFLQQGGTKEMALVFFNRYEAVEWKIRGTPIKNVSPLIGNFIKNWNNNTNGHAINQTGNKSNPGTSQKRIAALKQWGSTGI